MALQGRYWVPEDWGFFWELLLSSLINLSNLCYKMLIIALLHSVNENKYPKCFYKSYWPLQMQHHKEISHLLRRSGGWQTFFSDHLLAVLVSYINFVLILV